jgi:hypothetical protein
MCCGILGGGDEQEPSVLILNEDNGGIANNFIR